jgi:glutamyl-tRNA synthetase
MEMTASSYRGRIAPSPTGLLHVGHARTFWTAYQRARAGGGELRSDGRIAGAEQEDEAAKRCGTPEGSGTLVLRDEDLDPQRSRPEFAAAMLEDLRWLGIEWQEGPDVDGPFAPYRQSERREFYLHAWKRLLDAGFLYACSCSGRDLAEAAQAPHESFYLYPGASQRSATSPPQPFPSLTIDADEPIYPGACRGNRMHAETPAGYNWRFRVPDGEAVSFFDQRQGRQEFIAGRDFGDFVVWRRDGGITAALKDVPAYQLAVVVDDAAMRITEVVRGADLLLSTARQILLMKALAINPPAWFHCDLLVDEHGRRMAKRHDALSLRTLRQAGWTPQQIRERWQF